ncbi:MAG: MAP7 domain-containing protein [Legionellales bacterium]|jgi:chemotaxis protein histidine kinase CheA
MVSFKAWENYLKDLVMGTTNDGINAYRMKLKKLNSIDQLYVQAWYLNAFWVAYDGKDHQQIPLPALEEMRNVMGSYANLERDQNPVYKNLNSLLHKEIMRRNNELTAKLDKEKTEKEEQERKEQERQENERKEKEEQERKEQERKENERKEKEEQKRKEQERKENERKEKEEQKRKEQERKEKEQKEKEAKERKEQERREKERKEKEEQERKDKEQNEKARKEKEQKEQREKREQKINDEAERHKRAEERKLKEQEVKKNREEELKPLKEARRSLQVDDQWKIESFLNYINVYESTPNKQKDFLNGKGAQIKFLLKILSFMENHAVQLENKTLKEVLEIIVARYDGSLKNASEDKDQDYTFFFEKEVIELKAVPQSIKDNSVKKPKEKQPEKKEPILSAQQVKPEVRALMQACVSFGTDNFNPYNLSSMFLLSTFAYTGGFFLHKILNDSVGPVPNALCYSISTGGAFAPYVNNFYKQYQNHLAKNHFETAKKALLATPGWDIELFTNVVDKLIKAEIRPLDNLKEEDDKIVFLRKVIEIYRAIQRHTKVFYIEDRGLGILAALKFIYGDLEKASEHDLLLGQNVSSSKTISDEGKRLNKFLMLPDNKLHSTDELKNAQDFIAQMNKGDRIDVIYIAIYEYAVKNKSVSMLGLIK